MNGALVWCRWRVVTGVLANGALACNLPAYAAMRPISDTDKVGSLTTPPNALDHRGTVQPPASRAS